MPKDNSKDSYVMDDVLSPNFYSVDFYQKRKKGKYKLVAAPSVKFPVVDTHCHIEMFNNPQWVFIRCAMHNISSVYCVIDSTDDGLDGINIVEEAYFNAKKTLPKIVEQISNCPNQINDIENITIHESIKPNLCLDKNGICDNPKLPSLHYIIGTHPHYAKQWNSQQEKNLYNLLNNKRCVCVGEIGLDFYYDLSPRDKQIYVLKRQVEIAKELKFPISLHIRQAHAVALDIFKKIGWNKYGTLLHCFNLGPDQIKPWLDCGCYIAFGGPVTFKKADYTRKAANLVPIDKLLTETDAPFMTPEPLRGDTCFADHVVWTAKTLCEITGNTSNQENFYKQLQHNAKTFFIRG